MSLAKLTSISTKTLSLILERQRLQSLPSFSSSSETSAPRTSTLHLPQILRNLGQLKSGILALEAKEGRSEAVGLLRNQYDRMRGMLGEDANIENLEPDEPVPTTSSVHLPISASPVRSPSPQTDVPRDVYTPYTDDPEAGQDPGIMLQTQRHMMNEQDQHLDQLSHSINRQHHISLQINDELNIHTGLLEELDTDLDNTGSRLTSARRGLDRVARGAKENGSTVTIGLLILVLLILIIVFKT